MPEGPCEHLRDLSVADFATPTTPAICAECAAEGAARSGALRQCLTCGHIGCCDSSPGRHATRHFQESGHAAMRSVMPGDRWSWCYVHERYGEVR